jgi:hypothetical protein
MTVEEKAEKYAMDFVKSKYSDIYSTERKTHPSFLRGWHVSD